MAALILGFGMLGTKRDIIKKVVFKKGGDFYGDLSHP